VHCVSGTALRPPVNSDCVHVTEEKKERRQEDKKEEKEREEERRRKKKEKEIERKKKKRERTTPRVKLFAGNTRTQNAKTQEKNATVEAGNV